MSKKAINGGVRQDCAEYLADNLCRIKGITACGGAYPTQTTNPKCGTLQLCCAQLM